MNYPTHKSNIATKPSDLLPAVDVTTSSSSKDVLPASVCHVTTRPKTKDVDTGGDSEPNVINEGPKVCRVNCKRRFDDREEEEEGSRVSSAPPVSEFVS